MTPRQMLVVDRMIVERRAEHHRRVMLEATQQVRLAEQADQVFLVALDVAEVVDPVRHANAVEARRQVEEHPARAGGPRRTAHQEAHHAPRIAIERNPAVGIDFLEEKIERLPNLQLFLPIRAFATQHSQRCRLDITRRFGIQYG